MTEKLEGTIILEGLIEGPMPPFPDARQKIESWARSVAGGSIPFSVQIDTGHFSVLPGNDPVAVQALFPGRTPGQPMPDPSVVVADALSDLLRFFPPLERGQIFSTLRSMEFRPNLEVQTLYAVGPDGRAATRQQSVPAITIAAEAPISREEILKRGGLGLGVALVILLASTLVVPYRDLWRKFTATTEPAKISVDTGPFSPYFQAQITGIDRASGLLLITFTRTAAFPQNEAAFDTLYADPPAAPPDAANAPATAPVTAPAPAPATAPASGPSATAASLPAAPEPPSLLRRRLAIESLAKGVIRIEFRDSDGHLLDEDLVHISSLAGQAKFETRIPAPIRDKSPLLPASATVLPD